MSLFSKKVYITNNLELAKYIKSLGKDIFKMIDYGNYIISYESLENIILKKNQVQKLAIILNSNNQDTTTAGHWFIMVLDLRLQTALLIDSLYYILKQYPLISKEIKNFCLRNKLELIKWNLKTQQKETNVCGFQVIFYLYYFKNKSIYNFRKLRRLFASLTIRNRELYILKKIKKIL